MFPLSDHACVPPLLLVTQGSTHITNYCVVISGKSYYLDCTYSGAEAGTAANQMAQLEGIIEKCHLQTNIAGFVTDTPNVMQVIECPWKGNYFECLIRPSSLMPGFP